MKNLPPENKALISLSEEVKSIRVLVRVKNSTVILFGVYSYALGKWRVQGFSGFGKVVEWWPMPEIGTGNK